MAADTLNRLKQGSGAAASQWLSRAVASQRDDNSVVGLW